MSSQQRVQVERNVALCYIRQSFTRDQDDQNSPQRQRDHIQALVEHKGWQAKWYKDVGGHRSGRDVKNRPEWLRLKNRLKDPDVVALVANDMSRLHRKGWRVGDLVDHLERYGVTLVLAAPGREVDTSTLSVECSFSSARSWTSIMPRIFRSGPERASITAGQKGLQSAARRSAQSVTGRASWCPAPISHISETWERANPEDRQGMIRNLFEYLVYDLDTRRITDFRLKPWADRFLILRARMVDAGQGDLASEELSDSEGEKENPYAAQGVHMEMPHRGLQDTSIFEQLRYAARRMVRETYVGLSLATAPVSRHTPPQHKRNNEIRARHRAGEPLTTLAEVFGISEQRVYQIVHGRRK